MKKLVACTVFVILALIALIPAVNAGPENINNISGLTELPEMDLTGLHRDIPLIEIDPEIMNATLDWIVLVHDEDGKKSLLDDVNRSSVSVAEKTDMKNDLEAIWDNYPVKSEAAGEKSIEITVQSDGSNRTLSIPIGHVTRISFDRVKMGKDPGDTTIIVLPENINQTIRNISILRVNNITATPAQESSTLGSDRSSGNPGNSFSSGNSFRSGFSSSSGQSLDSSFPSSSENRGGYPGNGLVAWQGGWNSSYQDTDPLHDSGHNSYIYWACKHLNYTYKNDAAATAMAPDSWSFTDRWPEIPYLTALLNNYVNQVFHCWDHFYNPDYPNGIAGWANVFAATHADMSKTNYSSGNYLNAAQDLGHASHYMTDVANPMHTGQAVNQIIDYINQHDTHREYEDYVSSNWSSTSAYKFGDLVKNNNYSYRVRSPDEATINIATFSHAYVDTLYYKVKNQPGTGFYTDPTVKNITENCVLIAARYTGGLVEYTRENDIDEIPIADFDANPQSGSAPLSVNFIDKSHYYGSLPTTWRWDFGDGFTSDEQHPHQKEYQNNGNYTVKLTVSNANGQSNKTMIISVVGSPAPQADFNYATVGPSTIHFTDISTNSPTSWVWDFGDGSNASVEQNPTHQYSGGIFATVRLFASNVYGATIREEMVLVLNPWPIADFIPSTTSGPSPLSVQFTDNSTNYADNWTWDFGDNSPVSYQRNTSHTYNNPGNYSAVLTASNSYGNNTNTKVISVIPPPLFANFTANSTSGRAPLIVQFTDTSTGTPIIWNWSFGDGQTSTTQNPVHTFTQGGAYTIALNVTNATGSNSSIRTDYVIVNGDKVGVFRNSSGYGYWYLDYNNDGVIDKEFQFGSTADIPVVGDWDGNGTSDAGVFRPPSGYWYLDTNKNSSVEYTFPFGKSGDIPVVGDWDGDGISDIGVFRPPSGYWYLDTNKNSSVEYTFPFGKSGDIPVVGDWDGNGTSDAGIFRPSSGFWYLDTNKNSSVEYTFPFGKSGDIPVVGDWNGDGTSDAGVFRPSETNWYLDTNKINGSEYVFQFGTTSDIPVVGDWDGSGISDAGVFRPANGNWYLNYNKQNSTVNKSFHFGINNDTPKAGNWI